jgi:hypothetical protein
MWEWTAVLLVGVISSFIGTLVGGGALISLPTLMLLGIPVQVSIASNKLASVMGAFTSVTYLWKGKLLPMASILSYIGVALIGGVTGGLITASVDEPTMKKVAVGLMVFALLFTIFSRNGWKGNEDTPPKTSFPPLKSVLWSYLIALYDGGFGPGSTTFGILHFIQSGRAYAKAVQLTRVLIFGSNLGGFLVFFSKGFVDWNFAIPLGVGCMIGSQLGLLALPRVPLKVARNLIMVVMVVLIGQVTIDLMH